MEKTKVLYSPLDTIIPLSELYNSKKIVIPIIALDLWREDKYEVVQPWEKITSFDPPTWEKVINYKREINHIPTISKDQFIGTITKLRVLDDGGLYRKLDDDCNMCYGVAEIMEWTLK